MRILLAVAVLLVTISVFCDASKHDVDRKLQNDYKQKHFKTHKKDLSFGKHGHHHKKHRLRGAHLNLQEGGFRSLEDKWAKFPKGSECVKTKCGHKEFCLANPKTGEEKCISKHDYKESRRLFRSFHKQESLKKDLAKDVQDKDLVKAEHMKDVYDLINDYNKMEDQQHHADKKLDAKKIMAQEEVKPAEAKPGSSEECRPTELYELKKRMVGWFVLMHTESRRDHHRKRQRKFHKKHPMSRFDKHHSLDVDTKKKDLKIHHLKKRAVTAVDTVETESHHHCKCSKSAMWEFRKQDSNRDGLLSHDEMTAFSANRREPCITPLLKSCDSDTDGTLTHGEWCCCMAYTIPPCLEKKRLTDPKVWIPRCDKEGFYQREQCHDDSGYCWCVDLNGNEIVGTKTHGNAHCGHYDPNGHLMKE